MERLEQLERLEPSDPIDQDAIYEKMFAAFMTSYPAEARRLNPGLFQRLSAGGAGEREGR